MEKSTLDAWDMLTTKLVGWFKQTVLMLPNLLVATAVMVGFFLLANLISKLLDKVVISNNSTVNRLIHKIVRVGILFFGLFTALSILNLDKAVASLLAGAGVLGLAIGFAFQEIAANFFAGVLIAIRKPYTEGDIVQMEDFTGTVCEINLRTTNIRTFQGLDVLIPNKDMFTKPVVNYTKTDDRRVDVTVGISYADDLSMIEKIIKTAVQNVSGRTEREVEVFYTSFGDSSINVDVRVWIRFDKELAFVKARHEIITSIKKTFDANNIAIPFPIRTLDFGIKGGVPLSKELEGPAPKA